MKATGRGRVSVHLRGESVQNLMRPNLLNVLQHHSQNLQLCVFVRSTSVLSLETASC